MRQVWSDLPVHSKRWFFWQFVVGAFLVNAFLSALIAWVVTLPQDEVLFSGVPLIDPTSVLVDSLITLFILPFLTTIAVTTIVRAELRHGELVRPATAQELPRLPEGRPARAFLIASACLVVFGLPVAIVLALAGAPEMSIEQFVAYKAAFGALYGLFLTVPIALLALG